jgi:hypothetical protein
LTGDTQDAELETDQVSHYLEVQTKQEGQIGARFRLRDYLDFWKANFQLNPRVAPAVVAIVLANETAQALARVRFPGPLVLPAGLIREYAHDLVAAQLAALGTPRGTDHTDGPPIPLVVIGGAATAAVAILTLPERIILQNRFEIAADARAHSQSTTASKSRPSRSVIRLNAHRLSSVQRSKLYRAPFRRAGRAAITRAIVKAFQLPVPTAVRPLVVNRLRLRANKMLAVVAGRLHNRRRHKVILVVEGPGGCPVARRT